MENRKGIGVPDSVDFSELEEVLGNLLKEALNSDNSNEVEFIATKENKEVDTSDVNGMEIKLYLSNPEVVKTSLLKHLVDSEGVVTEVNTEEGFIRVKY